MITNRITFFRACSSRYTFLQPFLKKDILEKKPKLVIITMYFRAKCLQTVVGCT